MRRKSRRVGGVLKTETSGCFGQGELGGRQTRKLDFLSFVILSLTSNWNWKMVGLCVGGWVKRCVSGWVAGGCPDVDI